ncbi:MAG: hypothetical protein GXO54_04040 [Chloroflexi bacterium]|nr:hypothetical protein [Chloroflexota bacterium]
MNARTKLLLALGLFGWMAVAVALFYSTQRPIPRAVVMGLARTARDLGLALGLSWLAWRWGRWTLARLGLVPALASEAAREPLLSWVAAWAWGWALLSWGTLLLGMVGWARPWVFRGLSLGLAVLILILDRGPQTWRAASWRAVVRTCPAPGLVRVLAGMSALLALAPPEAFDTLLYHLALPEWLLRHGRWLPWPVYQFWHPSLIEGALTWPLAWGSEGAAQLIAAGYAVAAVGLAARWARRVFGRRAGRYTVWLFASMPSWLLLAAGAYVDWPLAMHALLALGLAWRGSLHPRPQGLWRASALYMGLALSTKTTAVPFGPVWALLLWFWARGDGRARARQVLGLVLVALAVMSPYYVRNAVYMGNPFYPFVFGGRAWDAFRMTWLAAPGTGLGTAWREWLLLPWTVTLGHRDAAYYHGRMGPLYLALAPLALALVVHTLGKRHGRARQRAVLTWSAAFGAAVALWLIGVARSGPLFQGRLLFPALALWAPVTAYAIPWSRVLDTRTLHISFLVRTLVVGVVALTLLENVVFLVDRAPWRYLLGFEDRDAYWARVVPDWADLRALLQQHTTPSDRVVLFFEPRSYGLDRDVLGDGILDNFPHALAVYGSPEAVLRALQCAGYTHVVVYRWGWDFIRENIPHMRADAWSPALEALLARLERVAARGPYELYRVPPSSSGCAAPSELHGP